MLDVFLHLLQSEVEMAIKCGPAVRSSTVVKVDSVLHRRYSFMVEFATVFGDGSAVVDVARSI